MLQKYIFFKLVGFGPVSMKIPMELLFYLKFTLKNSMQIKNCKSLRCRSSIIRIKFW